MSKFYFSRLSALHKEVYKLIATGIAEYRHEIPLAPMESDELSAVFNSVLLDNPLIFHVSSYSYVVYSGGKICGFKPIYECSKGDYENYLQEISRFLGEFDFMQNETDFKKELYVHDYCIKYLAYGDLFDKFSYSVLGAIVKKSAVCEGIAKFVKLVLDYLRVKCLVVKGEAINPFTTASEKHAWNIVKPGDFAYHLDVTFDL
jgi:transglutaminase/protease-like cytokinesis protein 3